MEKYFAVIIICIYFATLKNDFYRGVKLGILSFGKIREY